MQNIVLLGDSIFDNGSYVDIGDSVHEQLSMRLPEDWKVTMLAVDGATVEYVHEQLKRMPDDATHLFVSVGGNDALENSGIVREPENVTGNLISALANIQAPFRARYRALLHAVLAFNKPTAICTIYDAVPGLSMEEITGLSIFNDVIIREGSQKALPILDLRALCDEPRDYAAVSPIEPSAHGSQKIARAVMHIAMAHDFASPHSWIYSHFS